MDGKNPRRSNMEKWLFWAMFVWPVVIMVSVCVGNAIHSESPYYVATYVASPVFAAILAGIALHYYPASRRFLKWLGAIILLVALYIGQMYYFDSLQHGWKWVESATRSPVVWLDGVLVVLSVLYLVIPQSAWEWVRTRTELLWNRIFTSKS